MKRFISVAIIMLCVVSCGPSGPQKPSAQYEEKKSSLEDMEKDSPLKFLRISGQYHNNLLNQTVISGVITNKATLVGYKNIKIEVTFKDDEGNVIERDKQVLDDDLKANSTDNFKIKLGHVKNAGTAVFDVIDAVPM